MSQHLPRFDTAQIGPLRELLKKFSALNASIADIVQFRVVVDANCVVQNLIYRARHPERGATALEELIKATVVDVFAPRWLETEMVSAIRQAAQKSRLPQAQLWAHWMEFRLLLKWDDSLRQPGSDSAGCCDPKDLPYLTLERKLGADGILSKDAHIAKMGGHVLTLDFVLSARSYARAAVTTVSIRVLGTLLPTAAVLALIDLLRQMGRAFAALPNPLKILLVLGGTVALIHPVSRRWIVDRCADASTAMSPAWQELAELVTTLAAINMEAQSQATFHLQAATKVVRPKRTTTPPASRVRRSRSRSTSRAELALRGNQTDVRTF